MTECLRRAQVVMKFHGFEFLGMVRGQGWLGLHRENGILPNSQSSRFEGDLEPGSHLLPGHAGDFLGDHAGDERRSGTSIGGALV